MADWRSSVRKLVEACDRLPARLRDAMVIEPPVAGPWPAGLPSCPALVDFYELCGGGYFGHYGLCARSELEDLGARSGGEYESGRYLIVGDTEFGHPLVWDSREDRVGYCDEDGADGPVMSNETGMDLGGLSMEAFLSGLFTLPARGKRDEWVETLEALAKLG